MQPSGWLYALATLATGNEHKNTNYSVNCRLRGLGGYQRWSEHFGEEKNTLILPGIEPKFLGHPALA
jgi:hypothetical protein